jgi:tetratricopeptide (TPR) repeat protein
MGQLYEESGDLAAAEKELLKAIDLAPENDKTYFELAVLYDKMNRKEASIATMKKVLEISPDHANALNYLGYTYADLGIQLDEAEAMIKKAMELKPGDGYFTDSLGWVYYQKGLYDKALEVLLEAHRLAPEDPIIMEHVGDAYRMLGDSKRALEYYRRSLEAKEDDREGLVEKIRMMEAQPAGDKDPS